MNMQAEKVGTGWECRSQGGEGAGVTNLMGMTGLGDEGARRRQGKVRIERDGTLWCSREKVGGSKVEKWSTSART